MPTAIKATHAQAILTISLARFAERASYYGLRALIVLYMVGETFEMERSEALKIYGIFTAVLVFSQLLGAVLGDLVLGSKRGIIIGGCLQALGAFSLCIPNTIGLYLGIGLTVLGGGLYTPNIIAFFGKHYLTKTKLLDSGFTILYLAVNLGAFLGILLIGIIGERFAYSYGFGTAGILALISTILIAITKDVDLPKKQKFDQSIGSRIVKIILALLFIAVFWSLYELSGYALSDIQYKASEQFSDLMSLGLWRSVPSIGVFPISIIAILIWMRFYSNQFFKVAIGFFAAALSFGLLYLIPESLEGKHLIFFFGALLLLSIAEVYIAPIIHAVITKHTHHKFLAIVIAVSFLPIRLLNAGLSFLGDKVYDNVKLGLEIGMIAMPIIGVGALLSYIIFKMIDKN